MKPGDMDRTVSGGHAAGATPALVSVAIGLLLLARAASGQCSPTFGLTTPLPNNGQTGEMFDLEPIGGSPLRIESFDVVHTLASTVYEIWVRPPLQSFVGFNLSNAGWTQLAVSAPVATGGSTTPVPLNLCLGYTLQTGGRTGFYVTLPTGTTGNRYTNGTGVGNIVASDTRLALYDGVGGSYFNLTFTPRSFSGVVRYSQAENQLAISQSGPGVGDLTVSLGMLSPTGLEGWTLLSPDTSLPLAGGPILGINPTAVTWSILGYPYIPGSPFHFRTTDVGLFPTAPFIAPPGSVNGLAGQTLDAVVFMLNAGGGWDSRSNIVRYTFQ